MPPERRGRIGQVSSGTWYQVVGKIGGASRDRTDDLIVANDNALRLRHHDFNNLESDYVPLRSENLNCGDQMVRQNFKWSQSQL
jgi:hypothetical protein